MTHSPAAGGGAHFCTCDCTKRKETGMNDKERYMLTKLSAQGLEADAKQIRLRVREPAARSYNRGEGAKGGCSAQTSKLGRYRSLYLREKRLRLAILEKEAFFEKALTRGAEPSWFNARREKNELLKMKAELLALREKMRECLDMAAGLEGKVRRAVEYRYLDMNVRSMPGWKETAEHIGFEGSADELRHEVVEGLVNKMLPK